MNSLVKDIFCALTTLAVGYGLYISLFIIGEFLGCV
jgi:hypothetical protein